MTQREIVEQLLAVRNAPARIVATTSGPRLTRYTLAVPPEVPLGRITRLQADLSARFGLPVRILTPLNGEPGVVIEVPHSQPTAVPLVGLLPLVDAPLKLALGVDMAGASVIRDLRDAPHLLVAGSTGSGKSVSLNCMILSLLQFPPEDVRLAMIDQKRVELTQYAAVPHLIRPVATDKADTLHLLRLVVRRIESRYKMLERLGLRQWSELRQTTRKPYLVLVIDELADCIGEDEIARGLVIRIAQLGRAAGVHLVCAVQRPDSRLVSGILKAQLGLRLSFAVASAVDSRVVLDVRGAEQLLGRGDALLKSTAAAPLRIQGCLYSDADLRAAHARWAGVTAKRWRTPVPPRYEPPSASYAPYVLQPLPELTGIYSMQGFRSYTRAVLWACAIVLLAIFGGCCQILFGGVR